MMVEARMLRPGDRFRDLARPVLGYKHRWRRIDKIERSASGAFLSVWCDCSTCPTTISGRSEVEIRDTLPESELTMRMLAT